MQAAAACLDSCQCLHFVYQVRSVVLRGQRLFCKAVHVPAAEGSPHVHACVCRAVACTALNAGSSRSHVIVMLTVVQHYGGKAEQKARVGRLFMVDLAGSERLKKSLSVGAALHAEHTEANELMAKLQDRAWLLGRSRIAILLHM